MEEEKKEIFLYCVCAIAVVQSWNLMGSFCAFVPRVLRCSDVDVHDIPEESEIMRMIRAQMWRTFPELKQSKVSDEGGWIEMCFQVMVGPPPLPFSTSHVSFTLFSMSPSHASPSSPPTFSSRFCSHIHVSPGPFWSYSTRRGE